MMDKMVYLQRHEEGLTGGEHILMALCQIRFTQQISMLGSKRWPPQLGQNCRLSPPSVNSNVSVSYSFCGSFEYAGFDLLVSFLDLERGGESLSVLPVEAEDDAVIGSVQQVRGRGAVSQQT